MMFVKYHPQFATLAGCTNAALLLERIRHLFVESKGRSEFYKFDQPGSHPMCRKGDSWGEELVFNQRRLSDARKKIATRVYGGDSKSDLMHVPITGELPPVTQIVLYWRDGLNRTVYWFNEELLYRHLAQQGTGVSDVFVALSEKPLLQNVETVTTDSAQQSVQNSTTVTADSAQRSVQNVDSIDTENTSESSSQSPAQSSLQKDIHHHHPTAEQSDDDDGCLADSGIHEFVDKPEVQQALDKEHVSVSEMPLTERLLRHIGVHEPECTQYNHVSPKLIRQWVRTAKWLDSQGKLREGIAAFVMGKLKAGAKPPPPISEAPHSPSWEHTYLTGSTSDVYRSLKAYNRQFNGGESLIAPESPNLVWVPDTRDPIQSDCPDPQGAYWEDLPPLSKQDEQELAF